MVNRWMPSASEGDVLRLSMLILRREKMVDIRPIIPMLFSVYNVMVYSCFSMFLSKVKNQRSKKQLFQSDFTYRSEEHTSELQSRENLVCRLLLEKKK